LECHVLNRASGRRAMFLKDADYAAFEKVLGEALRRRAEAVELFANCLMPNHWHLVVRPAGDGDLSPVRAVGERDARAAVARALRDAGDGAFVRGAVQELSGGER